MPKRDLAPLGAPCWVDLMTADVDKSLAFYTEVFGWTASEPDEQFGGYINFMSEGLPIGGCMAKPAEVEQPDAWSIYLATDDAQKTIERAKRAGGDVLVAGMQVGDLGTMAVLLDADGAAIGIWQPGEFQGFGVYSEANTPSWFELSARDYDKDVSFYREVFSWQTHVVSEVDGFAYQTLVRNDEWLAGIMDAKNFLPEGIPAHWAMYIGVPDTDACLAAITSHGGSVVMPAEDTPYGRLASVLDPTGAMFKLVAPNASMPARPASN